MVIFHAGGWAAGSTDMIPKTQITALISLGFVVVLPEYRLCPQVSLYDGAMADAKDCVSWARESLPSLLKQETSIIVNPQKIVTMGHSAGGHLALHTGSMPNPPSAILAFYSTIYLSDPFFSQPLAAFAAMPDLPTSLTEQVYDGPQALTSGPMFTSTGPDLKTPRSAWMIKALKTGTHLKECVKDGNYDRVDPVKGFNAKFPPTCFVHGTRDPFVGHEFSERAFQELKGLGVESELVLVPDQPHVFDIAIGEQDPLFQDYVMKGLKFLAGHV